MKKSIPLDFKSHQNWCALFSLLILSLVIMIFFIESNYVHAASSNCPGADTNADGHFNIGDVTTVLDALSGKGNNSIDIDFSGDGRSNIADVTVLLDALSGTFDGNHDFFNGKCRYCKTIESNASPTISVQKVTVNKGSNEVSVTVSVKDNPGMLNLLLTVNVDNDVFKLKSATKGSNYSGLTLTKPGSAQTSSPYNFLMDAISLTENDKKDGTLFTMVFTIADPSAVGEYDIILSYVDGDIVDENFKSVNAITENGKIIIQ